MFGLVSAVRPARLFIARPVRMASTKKAADPVKDAFVNKVREYAKARDPKYTEKAIEKMINATKAK
eukprot:m.352268 g.352268  ORF g.352268 m.352268 type:complete len:66 (-) comp16479_c1_seq1:421-618(-)